VLALAAALGVALAGAAQPLAAQGTFEVQAQGIATVTGSEFYGGGLGAAYRTAGRTRVGLTLSAGSAEQVFAGRGELLLSYHLNPYKRHGVAPYAGAGIAVTLTSDESREYILLVLGVETNPGGRTGLFAEVGVAGGLRFAAGFQVRTGR
jgi:hypothetical protein